MNTSQAFKIEQVQAAVPAAGEPGMDAGKNAARAMDGEDLCRGRSRLGLQTATQPLPPALERPIAGLAGMRSDPSRPSVEEQRQIASSRNLEGVRIA